MFRKKKFRKLQILLVLLVLIAVFISQCSIVSTVPKMKSSDERVNNFPTQNFPTEGEVTVYWNEYLVPFIEAQNDADAAFTIGVIHAYLRLGQMEMLRMVAQGRLAEMFGPIVTDIDHTLKILNPDKAAQEIAQTTSAETKNWVDNYVRGVNWFIGQTDEMPYEYELFNIPQRKWESSDVFAMARLISSDLSWAVYGQFVQLMQRDDWKDLWSQYLRVSQNSIPSFESNSMAGMMHILNGISKSGSNSLAVSARKTAHGHALLANDPHLGIFAPNMWLLIGYKTPNYHLVGMHFPGLPFAGIGRNENIAWGGTNMRSLSTHLYELSDEELEKATERKDTIQVRGWLNRSITVRETEFGPVISDSPFFEGFDKNVAVKWLGHKPSYELTAFLGANRASNFDEFRAAMKGYVVSGYNLLYADNQGNIGHVLAYSQPILKDPKATLDVFKKTDNPIVSVIDATNLPYAFNPAKGFIASANNLPLATKVPIALQYTGKNRMKRMGEICRANDSITKETLMGLQRDVFSYTSFELKKQLMGHLKDSTELFAELYGEYWESFYKWDGHYRKESRGPVAYETMMYFFAKNLVEAQYDDKSYRKLLLNSDNWSQMLPILLEKASLAEVHQFAKKAFDKGREYFNDYKNWGEMHQITFGSPLAGLPLIGGRYRLAQVPVSGTSHTLMKTAHDFTPKKHGISYGSNARHISDMSDVDENYFVLLGGQDGWMKSKHNADQLQLWEEGKYIKFPLRLESIRKSFTYRVSKMKPMETR